MRPLEFTLITFAVSVVAGVLGSLLGVGGGIIVVPALTLLLHVDIRYAIGASIVSVIATSSGAAAAYVRERLANMRVAMVLEIATTSGAITGAYLAARVGGRGLFPCGAMGREPSGVFLTCIRQPPYRTAVSTTDLTIAVALAGVYPSTPSIG